MLTAVTFASAMTAWLGSVTRPLIEPVVDCPRTAAAQARKRNNPTVGACRIVGTSGTLILLTTSRFCQQSEDTHPKDAVGLARVRKIFLRSGYWLIGRCRRHCFLPAPERCARTTV